jgi:hypothetical protein
MVASCAELSRLKCSPVTFINLLIKYYLTASRVVQCAAEPKVYTNMLMIVLSLLILKLVSTSRAATCYRPGGFAADPRYQPCKAGQQSMCCRISDPSYPDICRDDGLCQETFQTNVIWRESCTDSTWQAPECLQLCVGKYW